MKNSNLLYTLLITFTLFHIPSLVAKNIPPSILKATIYKAPSDITQYWVSEKYDGIRGYWTGKVLLTKQGNRINHPEWFTKNWPTTPLDGELWIARDHFQQTMSVVMRSVPNESDWQQVRFMVFDLPQHKGNFTERITEMKQQINLSNSNNLAVIKQNKLNNLHELHRALDLVVKNKGEGLMLHHQHAYYHVGRSKQLMKLKQYQDAEATVLNHIPGKGKYQQQLGSLLVTTTEGITFKIGSGFSDQQRRDPPPIGSTITYKYVGKTQRGVPRFASFLRIRQLDNTN